MTKKFLSILIIFTLCFAPAAVFSSEAGSELSEPAIAGNDAGAPAADNTGENKETEAGTDISEESVSVGVPQKVKASGRDCDKIKVSWSKVSNADGYKVYRWSKAKKKYICIKTIKSGKKTSYTDSGLSIKSRYCYKVAAYAKTEAKTTTSKKSAKAVGWTLKSYRGISLVKPVKKSTHVSGYGNRGGAFHIGADYAAPKGTPVYAAASGTVTKSKSNYGGLGEGIVIKHSKGLVTWYGHLNTRSVRAGQKVKAGDKIGTVGSTGNAGSNHLHFEVWINGRTYDPQKFF